MKSVGLLLTICIVLFTGCGQSLFIKKSDLQDIKNQIKENSDKLETISRQQEEISPQVENLETRQEASDMARADFSEDILSQLQEITDKQERLDKRLKKTEKIYRKISAQEKENAENAPMEAQNVIYAVTSGDKQLVGAVEKVLITPPGEILSARIDTGAATSSLDASDIEWFERNGHDWVRFTITNPKTSKEFTLERRVVRNVKIIQAATEGVERRAVVELEVTVGKTNQKAEFTLSDRKHMEYPVLIGRNILMDIMVVDVSKSFAAPPLIPEEPKEQAGEK